MREAAIAAMLAGAMLPGAGRAAPFKVVTDAPESVWVLDEELGTLTWCRTAMATGPKVVDVFGADAQARPEKAYPSQPDCTRRAGGRAPDGGVPGFAAGGYGGMAGYGMGGYGAGYGGRSSVAVRPGCSATGRAGTRWAAGSACSGTAPSATTAARRTTR